MNVFEEIKSKLRLSDIVQHKVKLTPKGSYLMGLCPFHQEKTPSFTVSDIKKRYYCFGCHEHGDIFDFVIKTTGCTQNEALVDLARMANVDISRLQGDKVPKSRTYYHMLSTMHQYFCNQLQNSTKAKKYLELRGLDRKTCEILQLGYAPIDRQKSIQYLTDRGFSRAQILHSGLVTAQSDENNLMFLFCNRIMFPIFDSQKRIVGFGGRDISDKSQAKYVNSAENDYFKKGNLLYNIQSLPKFFHDDVLLVVEGYMDVAALIQHGYKTCVAALGTALGSNQLRMLWNLVDMPCICFDGDEAGTRAMFAFVKRALEILPLNKSLSFLILPKNEDPDSILRASGLPVFLEHLKRSYSLLEILRMHVEKRVVASDPLQQPLSYQYQIHEVVSLINDEEVRAHYKKELTRMLEIDIKKGARQSSKKSFKKYDPLQDRPSTTASVHKFRGETKMLAFLLYHPQLAQHDEDFILSLKFHAGFLNLILRTLIDAWEQLIFDQRTFEDVQRYLQFTLDEQSEDKIYQEALEWLRLIADSGYRETHFWTRKKWDSDRNEILEIWQDIKINTVKS